MRVTMYMSSQFSMYTGGRAGSARIFGSRSAWIWKVASGEPARAGRCYSHHEEQKRPGRKDFR
eukprot:scaffold335_cov142-Skeletonema_menzelii.AAC.3